jgi:hypothetical protein
MPSTGKSQYLQPDATLLASSAGDAFGGGSGNAELLIAANQLRWSEHLEAANLNVIDADATSELDRDEVIDAAGVDGELVHGYAVHGNYVIVVAGPPDGRLSKIPLHLNSDGSLERAEQQDTPEIAALRAQVAANAEIEDAKRQAEKIIADAVAKANEIAAKAAVDAQAALEKSAVEASEEDAAAADAESESDDSKPDPAKPDPAEGAATPDTPGEPAKPRGRAKPSSS